MSEGLLAQNLRCSSSDKASHGLLSLAPSWVEVAVGDGAAGVGFTATGGAAIAVGTAVGSTVLSFGPWHAAKTKNATSAIVDRRKKMPALRTAPPTLRISFTVPPSVWPRHKLSRVQMSFVTAAPDATRALISSAV